MKKSINELTMKETLKRMDRKLLKQLQHFNPTAYIEAYQYVVGTDALLHRYFELCKQEKTFSQDAVLEKSSYEQV